MTLTLDAHVPDPLPEPGALRRLMRAMFATDAEFVAFCEKHCLEQYQQFGTGMKRSEKEDVVLASLDLAVLTTKLCTYDPESFEQTRILLTVQKPRQPDPRFHNKNPYRQLDCFDIEHAPIFCGREILTWKLWKHAAGMMKARPRLLTILGPSGSGKSSVARAGLLARLQKEPLPGTQQPLLLTMRPQGDPIEALAQALMQLQSETSADGLQWIRNVLTDPQRNASGLFDLAVHFRATAKRPLVLLVDQFEEIYLSVGSPASSPPEEGQGTASAPAVGSQRRFVDLLLFAARTQEPLVAIIITLRSDFLSETARHSELSQAIGLNQVVVPVMTNEDLRRAIKWPAVVAGTPLREELVDRLLEKARQADASLPLLQVALRDLWDRLRRGEQVEDLINEIDVVSGGLARQAGVIFKRLTLREQGIAKHALVRMAAHSEDDSGRFARRRRSLADLHGDGVTEAEVLNVLRQFSHESARMVVIDRTQDGHYLAEVTHDSFFKLWGDLTQWIRDYQAHRPLDQRSLTAAKSWRDEGRPLGRLWSGRDLKELADYHRRLPAALTTIQIEFLRASQSTRNWQYLLIAVLAAVALANPVQVLLQRIWRNEEAKQHLLSTYVALGRQALLRGQSTDAVLWLHRAYDDRSAEPGLPYLLAAAMGPVDATRAVLLGHSDQVRQISLNTDGSQAITASYDNSARLWDTRTGRCQHILRGHTKKVWSAAFSADGTRAVTASEDGTARIWDTRSGELLKTLEGHTKTVWSASFSPDGKHVVTASEDGTARLWSASGGELEHILAEHKLSVGHAAFSLDGKRVLTSGADYKARIWDVTSGTQLAELVGHKASVSYAEFSTDGRLIATAGDDRMAQLWDETGKLLFALPGHENRVVTARFSPDNRLLVTTSSDQTARLWDLKSGRQLFVLKGHEFTIWHAEFSPDSKHVVTAGGDGTLRLWDTQTGRLVNLLTGHEGAVRSVRFSADGKMMATASVDGSGRVWDLTAAPTSKLLLGHSAPVAGAEFSTDGTFLTSLGEDGEIHTWNALTGKQVGSLAQFRGTARSLYAAGNGFVDIVGSDDRLGRWDLVQGRFSAQYDPVGPDIRLLRIGPERSPLITLNGNHVAQLWKPGRREPLATLNQDGVEVVQIALSRDGKRAATAGMDGVARIYETGTGRLLARLERHQGRILSITFSSDGRYIATTGQDKTARIYEAIRNTPIAVLKGHDAPVLSAAFSPDGLRLVTASEDRTARMWEVPAGKLLRILRGHTDKVLAAGFSPKEGVYIYTASADRSIQIWTGLEEKRSRASLAEMIRCRVPKEFEGSELVTRTAMPADCVRSVPSPDASRRP